MRWLLIWLLALAAAGPARAHEMSMAEMQLRETQRGEFLWQWMAGEKRPVAQDLTPVWPEGCTADVTVLRCGPQGLTGALSVQGVGERYSAAIVKVFWLDGQSRVYTLTKAQPTVQLFGAANDPRGMGEIASAYTLLGVEHILGGIDHLLFVVSLLFLVGFQRRPGVRSAERGTRAGASCGARQGAGEAWVGTHNEPATPNGSANRPSQTQRGYHALPSGLLWTITAFTAAHSLTLACSALGWLTLRSAPVEASIALSIVLVAGEALHRRDTLARRWPAVVAFLFGLVHGLGFAGALKEIGLPENHLLVALLTFNVGVELGQLLTVGLCWCLWQVTSRWPALQRLRTLLLYMIGAVAAYWSWLRVAAVLA